MTRAHASEQAALRIDVADEGFGLYHGDRLLATVAGGPVVSPSRELLEQMLGQLTDLPSLEIVGGRPDAASIQGMSPLDAYLLFSMQKDLVEQGNVPDPAFDDVLSQDPLLQGSEAPEWAGQLDAWAPSRALVSSLGFSFERLAELRADQRRALAAALNNYWARLTTADKVVFLSLRTLHHGHALTPLALIADRCSAVEYANAVMHQLDEFRAFRDHALSCQSYLAHFRTSGASDLAEVQRLIAGGETDRVEFKGTLCINTFTKEKDKVMTHSCLKTIAGFLNAEGGELLIGVADDGSVPGIEQDRFANDDKFQLFLFEAIKTKLGRPCTSDVRAQIHQLEGGKVCRVSCAKSSRPVFLKGNPKPVGGAEEFYVRSGPSTECLPQSQMLLYVDERFGIRKSG